MFAIVLGAAAGGGFPQWNSHAPACRRARSGDRMARPRTQASIAVSLDGRSWLLLNASPDLRQQIEANPCLHPRDGLRSSPIVGVALTGGDVDAIAGLLTLRERQPFTVYGTRRVHDVLDANPIFEVLARDLVVRRPVVLDEPVVVAEAAGRRLTLEFFSVPGKVPLYLEQAGSVPPIVEGETVGIAVADGRHRLFFIPGCAAMTEALCRRLSGADLVFFDGTLWTDDEMIRAGLGAKTGARMGHMSIDGPAGTIAAFRSLDIGRKILIHINNSNPVLLDDSPERALAEAAGWDVAHDGMEVTL
ncbi:MAG TPA: pyrroloquinoline quinone biosynthesis protein PqqB [Aliidongia sp.]|uniref:pyrroloquinoline quinone biosynthesis protein PqqB n=1 Tax=Aliidongia sp. TaxID=1914230 RepID=UPI002DDCBD6F|nr:pyrroloquinoline quinone biosynthesis protein PqqB [Aliidongia sp.]HEV2677441.1 pyrroloquinoline quinone biosynthesis protein PqqB [Aliidongia sp.]